ncbi:MAG: hypothetical protein Q9187_009354, partial [Circinaria calcarea]
YDSDNGFVADSKPTAKKAKTAKSGGSANSTGNKDVQKGKSVSSVGINGEQFWELSDKRRVAISEYGGKEMINIREYYEKDGELLPGKKGISLPLAQFSTLITLLPQIESALAAKGESIPRPDYGEKAEDGNAVEADGEEEREEEEDDDEGSGKKNFEATSEEED